MAKSFHLLLQPMIDAGGRRTLAGARTGAVGFVHINTA